MQFYNFKIFHSFIAIVVLFVTASFSQSSGQSDTNIARQLRSETLLLMEKAEQDQYNVRRVEYSGNTYIRVRTFRPKMLLDEGDIFTRQLLSKSLVNLSKFKSIYPVRPVDVEVRLDEKEKIIDLLIFVREKRQKM